MIDSIERDKIRRLENRQSVYIFVGMFIVVGIFSVMLAWHVFSGYDVDLTVSKRSDQNIGMYTFNYDDPNHCQRSPELCDVIFNEYNNAQLLLSILEKHERYGLPYSDIDKEVLYMVAERNPHYWKFIDIYSKNDFSLDGIGYEALRLYHIIKYNAAHTP